MKEFRHVLRRAVERRLADEPVALLFSGGTDSLTVLWTLLDLGASVRCYTFRLERVESVDSRVATLAVRTWKVPHEAVVIPHKSTADLAGEVGRLAARIGHRKTHVECTWPFLYVAPVVVERQVWCGLNADDLRGSARGVAIRYGKDPPAFRRKRRELMRDPATSAWQHIEMVFADHGKELVSPYRDSEVVDFLLRFSWQELNRPKQKMPALLSFADEFRKAAVYRRNDNLQCGSGIREYAARMLADPVVNVRNRKSMAGLYKDLGGQDGRPSDA